MSMASVVVVSLDARDQSGVHHLQEINLPKSLITFDSNITEKRRAERRAAVKPNDRPLVVKSCKQRNEKEQCAVGS